MKIDRISQEKILIALDQNQHLFPEFALKIENDRIVCLGEGSFATVYEMSCKNHTEPSYAIKVIGFKEHVITSKEFDETTRINWILGQENQNIMRLISAKEFTVRLSEESEVLDVLPTQGEVWEGDSNELRLKVILFEKLDNIIEKDRFKNAKLLRTGLIDGSELWKFIFEIGQAILVTHNNNCLHRDIKLENIFWDEKEHLYKLGDFGIAKETRDGNAETIAFTDGYGAPEIERCMYDNYTFTADIYSFGITLYLLYNELQFPGANGYRAKSEIQYDPDFVFPAPINASERIAQIIRKMCSFYPEERYQSMVDVLNDMRETMQLEDETTDIELTFLNNAETETFHEEKYNRSESEKIKREEEKKLRQRKGIINLIYRDENWKYFAIFLIVTLVLCKGMDECEMPLTKWPLFFLPAAMMLEAVLQRIRDLHWLIGIMITISIGYAISQYGFLLIYAIYVICIVMNCPVITAAVAIASQLWVVLNNWQYINFLDFIYEYDLGWIMLASLIVTVCRYFSMRKLWEKTTITRTRMEQFVSNEISLVLILSGFVLWLLQCLNVFEIPTIVERMHLVRTGILSAVIIVLFLWYDGEVDFDEKDERSADNIDD